MLAGSRWAQGGPGGSGAAAGMATALAGYAGLLLLSLVTLGIYALWYAARVARYLSGQASYRGKPWEFTGKGGRLFVILLLSLVLLVVVPSYLYLVYRWLFSLRLGDREMRWDTRFWPAVGFIFLQLVLTLLSALVYWPGAYVRLYAYFARLTVIAEAGVVRWTVGFDGPAGRGFLLLWGQTLLVLLTLGIYTPWAMARSGRWFAEHTSLESPAEIE